MGSQVSPPSSSAVVEIADELVERYIAQGWTLAAVEEEPAKPARASVKAARETK